MSGRRIFFALLAVCALSLSCGEKTYNASFPAMGTFFTVTAECKASEAANIFNLASEEVRRIESLMSPYIETSDVYRLNRYGKAVLSPETYSLIERSAVISEQSGGAFDISFVPLGALWDYKAEKFTPPDAASVKRALPLVNHKNILFYDKNTLGFAKRGMRISLGGIAKGYAVDRAAEILRQAGARSGMVNAGGNLCVFGAAPNGLWNVGVQHPRSDAIICSVKLKSGEAISTSGDYERFVMHNGTRYHHIIDPRTGRPARGFISVSVICGSAESADAASTAIFVMGLERAREFLKKHGEFSAVMIDHELNIYASESLRDRLSFFEEADIIWL